MSQPTPQQTPAPQGSSSGMSPSSILRLLMAAGPGSKITLDETHMKAFERALSALSAQAQIRKILDESRSPSHAPPRPAREPREARPPRDPSDRSGSARSASSQPPRPSRGAGALWTPEDEAALREGWLKNETIGYLAEQLDRSAGACFARLIKLGAVADGPEAHAARHLIRAQQPVIASESASWISTAVGFGFSPEKFSAPAAPGLASASPAASASESEDTPPFDAPASRSAAPSMGA